MAAERRVDRHYRSVLKMLKQEIVAHPERINTWLRLVNTARNIERIADHASKIAEAVVYLKEGEIFRHQPSSDPGLPGAAAVMERKPPGIIHEPAQCWMLLSGNTAKCTTRRSKETKPADS